MSSGKWTIAGNVHLEQRIRVEGMIWYDSKLLVTVERKNGAGKQTPIPQVRFQLVLDDSYFFELPLTLLVFVLRPQRETPETVQQHVRFWYVDDMRRLDEDAVCGTVDVEKRWMVVNVSFVRNATYDEAVEEEEVRLYSLFWTIIIFFSLTLTLMIDFYVTFRCFKKGGGGGP